MALKNCSYILRTGHQFSDYCSPKGLLLNNKVFGVIIIKANEFNHTFCMFVFLTCFFVLLFTIPNRLLFNSNNINNNNKKNSCKRKLKAECSVISSITYM